MSGSFAVRSGDPETVTLTGGATKHVQALTIGGDNITVFAGMNGPDTNADAVGLKATGIKFGVVLFKSTELNDTSSYFAVNAHIGSLQLLGLPPSITLDNGQPRRPGDVVDEGIVRTIAKLFKAINPNRRPTLELLRRIVWDTEYGVVILIAVLAQVLIVLVEVAKARLVHKTRREDMRIADRERVLRIYYVTSGSPDSSCGPKERDRSCWLFDVRKKRTWCCYWRSGGQPYPETDCGLC